MLWHAVTWCWRCWNMEEWLNGTPGAPAPCHIHVNVQPSTSTENEWEWTWTSTLQTEPHCLSRTDRCHSNQSVSADLLRHSLCCSLLEILKDWRRRLILCEDLYWRASTWESYWQGVIDSLGAEDHPNTFRKHPKTQDSKSSNKATCLYPQKSDVFHLTWTLELLTAYSMFIHYVHTLCSFIHFPSHADDSLSMPTSEKLSAWPWRLHVRIQFGVVRSVRAWNGDSGWGCGSFKDTGKPCA